MEGRKEKMPSLSRSENQRKSDGKNWAGILEAVRGSRSSGRAV